jgi:hypothetical protein
LHSEAHYRDWRRILQKYALAQYPSSSSSIIKKQNKKQKTKKKRLVKQSEAVQFLYESPGGRFKFKEGPSALYGISLS